MEEDRGLCKKSLLCATRRGNMEVSVSGNNLIIGYEGNSITIANFNDSFRPEGFLTILEYIFLGDNEDKAYSCLPEMLRTYK